MSTTTNDRVILKKALDEFRNAASQIKRRNYAQQILRELRNANVPLRERIDYALIFATKGAAGFKKIEGLDHNKIFEGVDTEAKRLTPLTHPDEALAKAREVVKTFLTAPTSTETPTAVLQPVDAPAEPPATPTQPKQNILIRLGQRWEQRPTREKRNLRKEEKSLKERLAAISYRNDGTYDEEAVKKQKRWHFQERIKSGVILAFLVAFITGVALIPAGEWDKMLPWLSYEKSFTWPIVILLFFVVLGFAIVRAITMWNQAIDDVHETEPTPPPSTVEVTGVTPELAKQLEALGLTVQPKSNTA